jgi:glycosyltransferase involved in cell wall biosynthesis
MLNIVFLGGEDVSARIDISKILINLGCSINIIGSESKEVFDNNNISYTKFNLNREFSIIDDVKSIIAIRKILKKYSKEIIVHAFDTKLTVFLPIAAYGLKNVKVVRTINGMGRLFSEKSFKYKVMIFIYRFIQRLVKINVDFTIFQNTDNYNYFVNSQLTTKTKSIVIKSSGINLKEYFTKVDDSTKSNLLNNHLDYENSTTFILVSRLIKQKGILNYLEAAKLCHLSGLRYNFLLIGQIDSNKDGVSIEEINKYKKYVNYLGRKNNIKEFLSIADVFVLPSYYSEGVPRVLLEASAMSLAILTTQMPGCNDVLVNGVNGLMININDSVDLFEKMKVIADNQEILKKMKINSKKHVENFGLEKVTTECFEIYKQISKL